MKKNFHKIPDLILRKVKNCSEDEILVFCILEIPVSDILTGKYEHLNIKMENDNVIFSDEIIPNENQGKHSNWNINGREIKRKDLPKETYSHYMEAPNWGDSYNGTHTIVIDKERYPVEFIAPRHSTINIKL
jgi:hypothetical protein